MNEIPIPAKDQEFKRRLKLIADSMADIEEFERGRADEIRS